MNELKDILAESKRCLRHARSASYPNNFSVSSHWNSVLEKDVEAIEQFETDEQAISYSLRSVTGFDNRLEGARSVIEFKLRELARLFPGFSMNAHPELREYDYYDKSTLEEVAGVPYSNIFLYHVNLFLRSTSAFSPVGTISKVIEIGSGYGGLARIFKIMKPAVSYTLVDLPESLFFAQIFLSRSFPDAKILYLDEENKHKLGEQFDFILVPVQMTHLLADQGFDIAINTGSLQEMTGDAVAFWMHFIEHQIQVKAFYSCNYFLKLQWGETGGAGSNLMCPVLDPFWRVRYFRINPEVVTVDAGSRNFLELYVERIPVEERGTDTLQVDASVMLAQAKRQPKRSDGWFENLWMAIWRFPTQESISEMLDGIRLFRLGLGATNLIWLNQIPRSGDLSKTRFPMLLNVLKTNKAYVGYYRRRVLEVLRNFARRKPSTTLREFNEEKFYRRMLSGLGSQLTLGNKIDAE
ncbi:MAG: putative sugar O-methyltransferase [SAR202 cluster bacterium]|nr:putative sugar O-methyltransferase [SAR202 cluster bacterium]